MGGEKEGVYRCRTRGAKARYPGWKKSRENRGWSGAHVREANPFAGKMKGKPKKGALTEKKNSVGVFFFFGEPRPGKE